MVEMLKLCIHNPYTSDIHTSNVNVEKRFADYNFQVNEALQAGQASTASVFCDIYIYKILIAYC